jgi:hypothetical protein
MVQKRMPGDASPGIKFVAPSRATSARKGLSYLAYAICRRVSEISELCAQSRRLPPFGTRRLGRSNSEQDWCNPRGLKQRERSTGRIQVVTCQNDLHLKGRTAGAAGGCEGREAVSNSLHP